MRALNAEGTGPEGFDFLSPFRFLLSCYDAAFDAFLAILLLFLGLMRRSFLSLGNRASFRILAVLVLGMAAFNRDFARLGIAPVYITEVLLAFLLIMVTPRLLVGDTMWLPRQPAARRIILIVSLYVIYGFIRLTQSILSGGDLLETLRNSSLFYYGFFCLLGWWILQGPLGKKRLIILLWGIVILSTLTNTYAALSFILTTGIGDDPYVKILSGHAEVFSLFSALIIMAALLHGTLKVKERPTIAAIAIGVLLLHILLVLFANQRSGVIALAAAAGLVAITGKRRVKLNFRWVAVAVIIAALLVSLGSVASYFQLAVHKYDNMLQVSDEPNAGWRFAMWLQLVMLWSHAPVFGVGFAYDFGEQDPWGMSHALDDRIDPHNSYVAILCRTGIIGLGLVVLMLWWTTRLLIRLKRQLLHGSDLFVIDSLLGCFIVLSVYASMNVTIESPYHGIFFWLLIGIAAARAEHLANVNNEGRGVYAHLQDTVPESEGAV